MPVLRLPSFQKDSHLQSLLGELRGAFLSKKEGIELKMCPDRQVVVIWDKWEGVLPFYRWRLLGEVLPAGMASEYRVGLTPSEAKNLGLA